jgi:hypothetical protein
MARWGRRTCVWGPGILGRIVTHCERNRAGSCDNFFESSSHKIIVDCRRCNGGMAGDEKQGAKEEMGSENTRIRGSVISRARLASDSRAADCLRKAKCDLM